MSETKLDAEIKRIQKEYERRGREIPKDYYSLKIPYNRFVHDQRFKAVDGILEKEKKLPLREKKILEIGCGLGGWFADFETWGANQALLHGIDLDEQRIMQAREQFPQADLRVGEASSLPWPSQHFDLVLQSTVFSSILLPELRQKIAQEMKRVLKPTGLILWYDFFWNNPSNPQVQGIKAREIRELFSDFQITLTPITLAPPLARLLVPTFSSLCIFLEKLKFLNTHYLVSITSCVGFHK